MEERTDQYEKEWSGDELTKMSWKIIDMAIELHNAMKKWELSEFDMHITIAMLKARKYNMTD